ncbi:hypothetical protein D9M69_532980 [compost metagenome]
MAALGELRQRVEGDEVAHRDAQRFAVGPGAAVGVDAQLDVIPADRQRIDLGVEGMSGGQQRQHAAAQHAVVGEQADPAALGEAARPAADRRQAEAAVVLQFADDRANGVEVRRHRAVGAGLAAGDGRADVAAAGQLERHAELVEALGDVAHDGVGETGRAGNGEHLEEHLFQVVEVGVGECGHAVASCIRRFGVGASLLAILGASSCIRSAG